MNEFAAFLNSKSNFVWVVCLYAVKCKYEIHLMCLLYTLHASSCRHVRHLIKSPTCCRRSVFGINICSNLYLVLGGRYFVEVFNNFQHVAGGQYLVEIFNNLQLVARGQYLVELEIEIPYYLQ